jgi:hypothetical protein
VGKKEVLEQLKARIQEKGSATNYYYDNDVECYCAIGHLAVVAGVEDRLIQGLIEVHNDTRIDQLHEDFTEFYDELIAKSFLNADEIRMLQSANDDDSIRNIDDIDMIIEEIDYLIGNC